MTDRLTNLTYIGHEEVFEPGEITRFIPFLEAVIDDVDNDKLTKADSNSDSNSGSNSGNSENSTFEQSSLSDLTYGANNIAIGEETVGATTTGNGNVPFGADPNITNDDLFAGNIQCEKSIEEILLSAPEKEDFYEVTSVADMFINEINDDIVEINKQKEPAMWDQAKWSGDYLNEGTSWGNVGFDDPDEYTHQHNNSSVYKRTTVLSYDRSPTPEHDAADLGDVLSQTDTIIDLVLKLTSEVRRLSEEVKDLKSRLYN